MTTKQIIPPRFDPKKEFQHLFPEQENNRTSLMEAIIEANRKAGTKNNNNNTDLKYLK